MGLVTLGEVRDWSGVHLGGVERVGGLSGRFGTGCGTLPMVRDGQGDPREVRDGLGDPPGGLGRVKGRTQMSGTSRGYPGGPGRVGGPSWRSKMGRGPNRWSGKS